MLNCSAWLRFGVSASQMRVMYQCIFSCLLRSILISNPVGEFFPLGSDIHKSDSVFESLEWIGRGFSFDLAGPCTPADGPKGFGAQD